MANMNTNLGGERQMIFGSPIDARKAVLLTFVAFLFTGFQCAIYGMLTVPITAHFGISSNIIIFFDGFGMWGQILAMATGGIIIRAVRGKNLLLIAAVLMIIGSVVSILAPNIYFYTTMSFVCNMAVGYVLVACNYMIIGASEKEGQSEGKLSVLNVFFSLGWMISAPVVGIVLFHSTWQWVFIMVMVLFVVFIFFLLSLRIDELTEVAIEKKISEKANGKKESFINPRLIITAVALFGIVYVEQIMNYYNQPHLHYDLMLNMEVIGMVIMVYSMCQLIGRAVIGSLVLPRVNVAIYIMVAAIVFAIVLFIYLGVHTGTSLTIILIIVGILGLCDSCLYPSILGYGLDQIDRSSSAGTSFMVTIGGIGIPLGTSLCGILGQSFGRVPAMMVGPVMLIIVAILIFVVSRMKSVKKT